MPSQIPGQTDTKTSRLGFGCVRLTTHPTRAEAVRILEHAFACGVTHFDVARAYGSGHAEGILGEFLRGKRDQVTVATKFGILPPAGLSGNRWAINAAKKILGPFLGLLRRAQLSASRKHGGAGTNINFTPQAAIESLQTSLRELGTDYVDILLLHEATLAEAANPALIEALQGQVAAGTVRSLGIATDFAKLANDASLLPPSYKVVQFNDNAADRNLPKLANRELRSLITHSVFKPAREIQDAAATRPQIVREFSSRIGADLHDPAIIGSLLVHYALQSNSGGVVLFASSSTARITTNVKAAESAQYNEAQLSLFAEFVDMLLNPAAAGLNSTTAGNDLP